VAVVESDDDDVKRIHLLGALLKSDTGRIYHGSSLDISKRQVMRVVKKADFDEYERQMQRREALRTFAVACLGVVVAAFMVAAVIALVSVRMP
jgi:hypothetical protein